MTEIFSGNYPEASLPNDVDDIYIDSLKEQADKLGILVNIKEKLSGGNSSKLEDGDGLEKKNSKKNAVSNKPVDPKISELEKHKKKQVYELRKIVTEKQKLEVF